MIFISMRKNIPYHLIKEVINGKKEDIDRLLYDIHDFNINQDLDLFYCLQNITLVENPYSFNVVDGQQRLTTLTIILSYLEEFQLINGKLQYNVRQETEDFLKEFIFRASGIKEINTWDELLVKAQANGKDYDYQDIYYIFNAYKTVQAWFDLNSHAFSSMKDKILNHAQPKARTFRFQLSVKGWDMIPRRLHKFIWPH